MSLRSLRRDDEILLEGRPRTDVIRRALICLLLGGGCLAFEKLLERAGISETRFLVARLSGFLGWSFLVASTWFLSSLLGHGADVERDTETTTLLRVKFPKEGLGGGEAVAERSQRIDELYAELRPLMSRAAAEPALRGEIRAKLSVLRRLQTEEADEMEKRFDAGLLLKRGEGWKALERARELLSRYEDTPLPDAPTPKKG